MVYQEHGGLLQQVQDRRTPREHRIVNPRTGNATATGRLAPSEAIKADASFQAPVIKFHGPPAYSGARPDRY